MVALLHWACNNAGAGGWVSSGNVKKSPRMELGHLDVG